MSETKPMIGRLGTAFVAVTTLLAASMSLSLPAQAAPACAAQYVLAPDKTSLSILFDNLSLSQSGRMDCEIAVDLDLPAGMSLGVYRVDYRGYASLAKKDTATLEVQYNLGPKGNGRQFKRGLRGATDADFAFSENIGAGLMKRVGCGSDARLTGHVTLSLAASKDALVSLDSGDGGSRHGLEYKFDLKAC